MNTTPSAEAVERERIARIIDPVEWRNSDAYRSCMADSVKERSCAQSTVDSIAMGRVEVSLAKADKILAALQTPPREGIWDQAKEAAATHAENARVALGASSDPGVVELLREAGWSVAVHNDYRLNGERHTFWLWTHPSGRYVKGEGTSDNEALSQCLAALQTPAPSPSDGEVGHG